MRLSADVAVSGSNGDYCHGFLRAHGRKPGYGISELFEKDYAGGGIPESLGLPNSPCGQTYRKYASEVAHDGVLTPAIVVAGNPSVSVWSNWSVSSLKAEKQAWGRKYSTWGLPRERDRIDEAAYDRGLAADVQHTAKVAKGKCGPELWVDGRAVQPVIYKGRHCSVEQIPPPELFAGHTVTNAHIPLMVKDIRLGRVPGCRGYWTKDGFDAKGAVREIKDSMRLVPDVPFVLAIGCNAYPEFAESEHPDEAWRHKDGKVVLGNSGLVRHPDGGREALALAVVFLARLARRRQALPEVACGGTQGAGTRQAHCRNTHVRLSGRTVLRVLSRLLRAGEGGVRGLLPRRGARFDELRVLLQADGAQGAGGVCA